jgi:hypothetical protein
MFEEVEINTNLYILGQVTKGNKPAFLKFEVWVRVEETDTEITGLMTQQQLTDLKQTFLWERELADDAMAPDPTPEECALQRADYLIDQAKVAERLK